MVSAGMAIAARTATAASDMIRGKGRAAAVAAAAAMLLLAGCGEPAPPPAPPPPEVEVLMVRPQAVAAVVELPGRVQAVRTAEVRARVDGIVQRRVYDEGTDVRAGQVLFLIDPRERRADYEAAQAALRRAEVEARNAAQVVQRYKPLVGQRAISGQEYDAALAAQSGGEANVASARAQLDRARLDLNYTSVNAPISGRAGRAEVTEGALVSAAAATLMTRIEQIDRVYVNFSQSSGDLLELRRDMAAGRISANNINNMRVTLLLEDGSEYGPEGRLDFLDLAVDEGTGTVSLRAEFPNPQRYLLPGQFVRARVETGTRADGIMVPQRAVRITANGSTVLVVGANDVVAERTVKTGAMRGSEWVIESGLKPGDRVIVNGLQAARPGSKVRIAAPRRPGGPPPSAQRPAPAAATR